MNRVIENPHTISARDVIQKLNSNNNGLNDEEAKQRLLTYGPNELTEGKTITPLLLFVKQFKSWLVIILIIAAFISWFAGQTIDTWVIVAVVFINSVIGFSQEYRAEKAIASLKNMIVKTAKVIRDGELFTIPTFQLVPGDIMVLEEGDGIPADARIIHSKNFRVIEASLTGESLPVSKKDNILLIDTVLSDRKNMVWKSTFVAGGYAKAIVTGTGINTAIGDISETISEIKPVKSNFRKKTDLLARQMSLIAIISASLIFLIGYFIRNFKIDEILLTSIAALVAAIPEGMPAVLSIVLAIGAQRMAQRNAIIREFTATEALGAVTTILTDKTGTLTQNSLTVRKVFVPGEKVFSITGEGWFPAGNFIQEGIIIDAGRFTALQKLLKIAAISNNSEIRHDKEKNHYELIGDPTEGALSVLARKGGLQPEHFQDNKLDDLPFDSKIKLRATLIKEKDNQELLVTGAPESLLDSSESVLTSLGETKLTDDIKEQIQDKIVEWSNHAMRVIALAYKKNDNNTIDENNFNKLVFVGIVGMIDPPRPDSKMAVEKCMRAGIRVVMVTGDHVNTAVAIAKASGIINNETEGKIMALTENQLLQLNPDEFRDAVSNISVFARLTPVMKLKIAETIQSMGHLIAMTGDGVNDAPALKKADVGISMGIMGTDVARSTSDIVLADDNFSTIVSAVEEGRIVFINSRQTGFFLITTNIAESVTLLVCIGLGFPLPLTATQILWLNLVTDGVTAMALATEPGHGDIMKSKPVSKTESILNKKVYPFLFINVILMAGLSLTAFLFYMDESIEKARTGVFIIMAFTQLFNIFNLRSISKSVFEIGMFSNKFINLATAVSVLLVVFVTEIPMLASIFHFQSLHFVDFIILFSCSSSVLWSGELYKMVRIKILKLKVIEL